MYNEQAYFSKKITLWNAVLTVMIVILHADPLGRFGIDTFTGHPFIHTIKTLTNICVPLFFFISALLFYRNCEFSDLKRKLTSRIYTLLIPYLVWNTIFVGLFFIITHTPFIVKWMHMGNALNNPWIILYAIVDSRLTPLWFIRNLMYFCVLSPLFLLVIKKKWMALVCLVLSIAVNIVGDFEYQSIITWLPVYLMGAIMGKYLTTEERDEMGATFRKLIDGKTVRTVVSIGLTLCFGILYALCLIDEKYLFWFRLLSPLIVWIFSDLALYKVIGTMFCKREWMNYTFIIYCMHSFLLNVEQKLITIFLKPSDIVLNLTFILTPFITIVIITYIARYLSRFSFYKYLSGNR